MYIYIYTYIYILTISILNISCKKKQRHALSSSAFNLQEFLSCRFWELELVKFQG